MEEGTHIASVYRDTFCRKEKKVKVEQNSPKRMRTLRHVRKG